MVSIPWEWCLDWTGPTEGLSAIEPSGPLSSSENKRVGRGSAANYDGARSAKVNPQDIKGNYGYRLICPVTLKW